MIPTFSTITCDYTRNKIANCGNIYQDQEFLLRIESSTAQWKVLLLHDINIFENSPPESKKKAALMSRSSSK